MIKVASQALDKIKDFVTENPKTAMGLLGGGLGAVGGLALTSEDENETPGDRMKRRLKNALVLGGLGAGAGSLLGTAKENFETAIPESIPTPEKSVSTGMNILTHPALTGTGAGIAGVVGGNKLRNSVQRDLKQKLKVVLQAAGKTGLSVDGKTSMSDARAIIPELINASGKNQAKVLAALHSQFGTNNIGELATKLQHYGVSTSVLESLANTANMPDKKSLLKEIKELTEKTKPAPMGPAADPKLVQRLNELQGFKALSSSQNKLMKFLRRNKYTAGVAALAGLGTAGISSLFRD